MGSDALSEVGGGGDSLGRWQVRLAVLLALPMLLTGLYNTNYVFLAAPVSYRCRVPECEGLDPGSNISLSVEWSPEWLQWALPIDERCRRWRPAGGCSPHAFDNTTAVACKQFVYWSKSTIVAEFNLACQEWKRSLVGMVHNIGMLISLPIMGFVSDRYGRRAVLVACGCGVALLGLCKSFANAYIVYLVAELLETIMGASIYPAAFVLMIEWLGVKHRILASLLLGIPLSFGTAGVALLDYVTGYWRLWARVAYPPAFILLLYLWLLPESVRWLVTSGRMTDAVRVVKKAARCNRVAVSDEIFKKILMNETNEQAENKAGTKEEGLIKAFIKYGALRRRLCVCFVWWMSAVFVYYGLAVRAHALAGSPHVNYALVAAAELPALLLNTLLLDRVGRRPLLTAAFVFTAISLIALSCLPKSCGWGCTALYLVGKVGATMSLNALYVYTAELFPTRARHRLLAACSTLGRLGSILAPLTPLLAVYGEWVPTALFGALPVASAALTPLVPDTLRRRLPDTFADLDAPAPTPPSRTTATTATTASSVTQHKGAV